MGLRLYLDDCAYSKRLARLLREAGHEVVTPSEAEISGADDETHLAYARARGLIVVTKNPDDFAELHTRAPDHPGILAIYQDNSPRDMSDFDIARALKNLLDAQCPVAGTFMPLKQWRY